MPKKRWVNSCSYVFSLLLTLSVSSKAFATVYTVTKTADTADGTCDADCSLREAITAANGAASNTVEFNIPGATDGGCTGAGGVCTISPTSALPSITQASMTINGYTQNSAVANTNANGDVLNGFNALNTTLKIVIDGVSAGAGIDGLTVSNVANGVIKGLVIMRFTDDGISVTGASATGVKIQGCFIGADVTGELDRGNTGDGIEIITSAVVTVGTDGDGAGDPAERNLISGNNVNGVFIGGGAGSRVAGNFIGTDKDGASSIPNTSTGVYNNNSAASSVIGTNGNGTADNAEGNLISGNGIYGVYNRGNAMKLAGNYIGLNAGGTAAIANNNNAVNGTSLGASAVIGTNGDGTSDDLERNVISGNAAGINVTGDSSVVAGNIIGLNSAGTAAVANGSTSGVQLSAASIRVGTNGNGTSDALERNIISGNTGNGINLANAAADNAVIAGNYIGVAGDGTTDMGNGTHGIYFSIDGSTGATIGGDIAAEANIIAYNGDAASEYGVYIVGAASDNNDILRNSFINNQGIGINLNGDGANNNQAAPSITGQSPSSNDLILSGTSSNNAVIQLFLSDDNSDGAYDEGQTYVTQVTANGSGAWSYTLTTNKSPNTRFVATATDATNGTSEFSSVYTVTNEVPVVSADSSTGNEDTNQTITLPVATDGNGDAISAYKISTLPSAGSLYQTADGTTPGDQITSAPTTVTDGSRRVIFVPAGNGNGNGYGNFGYKANDGTADSSEATITVNVTAVNDAPTANAQSPSVNQDTATGLTLTATDPDAGATLTYSIVANPTNGTLSNFNSSTGTVTYTPNVGYTGADSLTFKANDGTVDSNTAAVSITVNSFARNVTWSSASQNGAESAGTLTVTATLSTASAYDVTVPFTLSGTATGGGTDYSVTASPLTITAGGTTANATITVNDDAPDEADETVILTMGNPTNASQGATTVHTATIQDNDASPTVTLSISGSPLAENGGAGTVTATSSAVSGQNITVNLAFSGTGTLTDDYTRSGSSISINAGSTTGTVTLTGADDLIDEDDETAIVDISSVTNGTESGTQQVTATITDDDTAGFTRTETGNQTTATEGGATDTFALVLNTQPTADVIVDITADADASLSSTDGVNIANGVRLTFTSANWNTAQTVTVASVNDNIAEGNHTGAIAFVITTADSKYSVLSLAVINASITDNDSAGVSIVESGGGTNVAEAGGSDSYTVVLTSEPLATVTITLTADENVTLSTGTLAFTAVNWNTPQTVTVTAVDDEIAEGTHIVAITHVSSSSDAVYNGLNINNVLPSVADNDTAGVTVTESAGTTQVSEGGTTDTYTVVLTSKPTAPVTIAVVANAQIEVSPTSLVFTASDWKNPQIVTVGAPDDGVEEGPHSATITHSVSSTDGKYKTVTAANVTVAIEDAPVDESEEITARAGPDATILAGKDIYLDGTASTGTDLSFHWVIISGSGSFNNPASSTPVFTADSSSPTMDVTIRLTVTDKNGQTATDDLVIHIVAAPASGTGERMDEPVVGSYGGVLVGERTTSGGEIVLTVGDGEIVLPDSDADGFQYSLDITGDGKLLIGISSEPDGIGKVYLSRKSIGNLSGEIELSVTAGLSRAVKESATDAEDFLMMTGNVAGDGFGEFVAVSDIDEDGNDEILVAAPHAGVHGVIYVYDDRPQLEGVIFGSADYPLSSVLIAAYLDSDFKDAFFGPHNPALNKNLAWQEGLSAGDKSRCGYWLSGENPFEGEIRLASTGVDAILGDSSAYQSAAVGDLNGDGEDDLALVDGSSASVYFGPVDSGSELSVGEADVLITDAEGSGDFGRMAVIGDATGDGFGDLIIGDPEYGTNKAGAVYVIFGSENWDSAVSLSSSPNVVRITGEAKNDRIGSDLLVADGNIYTPLSDGDIYKIVLSEGGDGNDAAGEGGSGLGPGGFGGCSLSALSLAGGADLSLLGLIFTLLCFRLRYSR